MKPFWRSKVVWFNAIVTILAGMPALLSSVAGMLSPQAMGAIMLAVGIVNLVLRAFTTEMLTTGGDK